MTGYTHPDYAGSLAEFGTPRKLPRCGGWILERRIPGSSCSDATGCYPLFVCKDWSKLDADLKALEDELVSLSLVTDPFGNYDRNYLDQCFADVVIPFKEHFVVDLKQPIKKYVCKHHRRYARKALRRLHVEQAERPIDHIEDWSKLYEGLISKHDIKGISAFSRAAFNQQLKIPGLVMFRAAHEGSTVGILLWYVQEDVGYYHLGASNFLGYEMHASFALFWHALEYFKAKGLRWLDLGGGAGIQNDATDGLSEFKRGWSTGFRTAYFCGHIFNRDKYSEIMKRKGIASTKYFPGYRKGERG